MTDTSKADICWPCQKVERSPSGTIIKRKGNTWACFTEEGPDFKSLRKNGNIILDGSVARWPEYGRGGNYAEKNGDELCKLFAEVTQQKPDDFVGSKDYYPLQYDCARNNKCRCKVCPEIDKVTELVNSWKSVKPKGYGFMDQKGKKHVSSCDKAFAKAAEVINLD